MGRRFRYKREQRGREATEEVQRVGIGLPFRSAYQIRSLSMASSTHFLEYLENGNVKVHLPAELSQVLNKVGEDDPAVLVAWDHGNVHHTVNTINDHPPELGFLGIRHFPTTDSDFQGAIINHMAQYTGGNNIEDMLIAPNGLNEFPVVYFELCTLGLNGYLKQLHDEHQLRLPLGRIFVLADNKEQTTATPLPGRTPLGGIPLFL
ncbi:hypothetical protein R1sor_006239 [Riccia sorocarpa]|uniref:Uncharacterized protein n=1 Tax=Riccia sorocarpa TaxID=122646 RepID=A0ABD3HMB8_9MARC